MDHPFPFRVEAYHKQVIRPRPINAKTAYFKFWGAIGDYYYFMTFIRPMLERYKDHRRVMVADVYARYGGNPVLDICREMRVVDELWTHSRRGGGPNCYPKEMCDQFMRPDPRVVAYIPGIYYKHHVPGPGGEEFPVEWIREYHRMNPKVLIDIPSKSFVREKFPQLQGRYVTIQPNTLGKKRKNVMPIAVQRELANLPVQRVLLQFPADRKRLRMMLINERDLKATTVVVPGAVESLWVLAHSLCHVGVESSQLLGAAIHDVPSFFFPSSGCGAFERDLALGEVWKRVDWEVSPVELREEVERAIV